MNKLTKTQLKELRKNPDDYDLDTILKTYEFSEDFIREFSNYFSTKAWRIISNIPLTETFIREFQDKLDFYEISYYSTLSEEFNR